MAQKSRFESSITVTKAGGTNYSKIMGKTRAYKRSRIAVREGPKALVITISANDPAALRASMNATMRQIQVIEAVTGRDFRKTAGKDRTKNI